MESIKKYIFGPVKFYQSKSKYLCLLMKSIKKWIFVQSKIVNRINQKVIFVSVNGHNQKANICVC